MAADLDIATWDSYPLGALEEQWFDPSIKAKWLRTGHPDFASFNHDVYRGMSKLPFWVMEQQPGPVNWAHWNPAPLPGMVRLWSWEAFAHGAGCVSYFRWRQAPFAQEQMHAGLNTPDNQLDMGGDGSGAGREGNRRKCSPPDSRRHRAVAAKVALVWDYEAKWLFEIHPQGADFHYPRFAFEYYSALRSLGLDVDIVPVDAPLDGYKMIVVPPLPVRARRFCRAARRKRRAGGARTAHGIEDAEPHDSRESAAGTARTAHCRSASGASSRCGPT